MPMNKKALSPLIFLLATGFAVFAYWPQLNGGYMFDDYPNIIGNGMAKLKSFSLDDLYQVWSSGISSPLGRPVAMMSIGLNSYWLGEGSFEYKVVNLAIHLLTGLAIYWFASLLARAIRFTYGIQMASWFAPTVAALWLIHPFNLTPVLYIVQRMTSLAALFMVLSLAFYTLGRLRILAGRNGGLPIGLSLLVFAPLAVGSKEIGALLPWLIVGVEWFVFQFGRPAGNHGRWVAPLNRLLLFGPLLAAVALLLLKPGFMMTSYEIREFTLVERLLSQPRAVWFYLGQTVVPDVSRMGLFHDTFAKSTGWLQPWTTLPAILGLAVMFVASLLVRLRAPLVGLGLYMFLIGHSLEAGPLALEMIHEHRNYFPSMGLMIALISGLSQSSDSVKLQRFVPVMTLVLSLLFASALYLRAQAWGSPLQLLTTLVTYHPESPRARYELGRGFALLYSADKTHPDELFDEALTTLQKAHELNPRNVAPTVAIILLHWFAGEEPDVQYRRRVEDILRDHSHIPVSVAATGTLLNCRRKPKCPVTASDMLAYFLAALSNDRLPDIIKAQWLTIYSRFLIQDMRAIEDGIRMQKEAVELSPKDPRHKFNLVHFLALTGRINESMQYLRQYEESGELASFRSSVNFLTTFMKSIENESLTPEEIDIRWKAYNRRAASAKRSEESGDALTSSLTVAPDGTHLGH